MSGGRDLARLLRGMSARLVEGVFVFVTIPAADLPAADLLSGLTPRMQFQEAEGLTLILPREQAEAAGLACEFACRMITLEVHSALDAVGFLAVITAALAKAGMGVNPVSGFYHDHLFVPLGREAEAMRVLADLAGQAMTGR